MPNNLSKKKIKLLLFGLKTPRIWQQIYFQNTSFTKKNIDQMSTGNYK